MAKQMKIVHYLNQFFGRIGGEANAVVEPQLCEGPVGPGVLLQEQLGKEARIIATLICGDNYAAENEAAATARAVELIRDCEATVFVAGPAFNAGRYGVACGAMCEAVARQLGIAGLTGMHEENPGAGRFARSLYVVRTGATTASMRAALQAMATLTLRLGRGERPVGGALDGCLPRGRRMNIPHRSLAAERAVAMLLRKLDGLPVESEIPFHATVSGRCAPPIRNLAEASIALVTESGFVPQGNPDRLPGLRSQRHFVYPIHHLDRFEPGDYESIHSGYDKTDANNDPNRLVPLDALRELERLQAIRSVHGQLYTTAGCATYLEKAQQMAQRIAADLKRHEVDGVVLTST